MILIPINPVTIPLITILNEGVEPLIEDTKSYYVYYGDEPSDICSEETMQDMVYSDHDPMMRQEFYIHVKAK